MNNNCLKLWGVHMIEEKYFFLMKKNIFNFLKKFRKDNFMKNQQKKN